MSLESFYECSIFEWVLYLERFRIKKEKEKFDYEIGWSHTREVIAAIWNINRDPSKRPQPYKGSDIVHLSFDEKEEGAEVDLKKVEQENAEYFRKIKSKMGSKFKKDAKQ